ncbi:MAG TPA: hypothetical protein VK957_22230 [Lunatimonas sp.]|nr:hypothetical protein [Lunatimonas sp.]
MHHIKVQSLLRSLDFSEIQYEPDFSLEVSESLFDKKSKEWLRSSYNQLGGKDKAIRLSSLRFDFAIDRHLFLFDNAVHFNRYRSLTLKNEMYLVFTYPWAVAYERLCRQQERACLQAGLQDRIWNGPPLASKCFGPSEESGDLSGNGSAGWKLNAYNDMQYDLISRLHGFKLVRIPEYETIMTGGSLKKIDQLLLNPSESTMGIIGKWLQRKLES